jgi:LCP family protein required for cell wall assembly
VVLVIIIFSGGAVFWKVQSVINKISVKGESVGSIVHAGLDTQGELKGEADGQINFLALGVLGAGHPGGGLNTDTIMVVSMRPKENKMSMVSIPRDLWVTDPGKETKSKINAVYAIGEERGAGQGLADMEKMMGEITGLPIHYSALISTQAFSQLVDTFGGVEIDLAEPFEENAQFTDIKVCDEETYTIPTGEYQYKKDDNKKVIAQYPLCKNKNPECGGEFRLPAGKNLLNGEKALCFARSRYLSTDFERAKRQQLIINKMKEKVFQLGLTDFGKINSILDNLGGNVRTDMQLWEMRRAFDLYRGMDNPKIYQWVLEDSKEGLLYSPDKTAETGFILLPRGDNYDDIKKLFQNIFNSKKGQSDIEPSI